MKNLFVVKIREPKNRFQKRKLEREYNKLKEFFYHRIVPLEIKFTEMLFTGDVPYKAAYKECLNQFKDECELKQVNLDFLAINKDYFSNNYKPVENEKI